MYRKLSLWVVVFLLVPSAWAQTSTGTVSGTVADESGAVIPGASVELTNVSTNVRLTTLTNEAGFYIFRAIAVGSHRISVELPGFRKYEAPITVSVRQSVVINPVLRIGELEDTVIEVEDVTPMVTVDSPALRQGMERSRIEQLPIDGRNIQTLVGLLPGFEGSRTFGAPPNSQEYFLDGSAESDRRWGGVTSPPGLDSVQEFSVESNAISAEHSRPVTVVISTKTGTNQFHGTAYETHRNNAFGLARRRQDFYDEAPQLIRNEFGGTAGGPVLLPGYDGRNRTFWFSSFEALRQVQGSTMEFRVPTMEMRQGDFSGLVDSQGRQYAIHDPLTTDANGQRLPFAYQGRPNVIDPGRISPVAEYLFSITPEPTHPQINPLVDANWFGPVPNDQRNWTSATRFDHRLSDRDSLYARVTFGENWSRYSISQGGQRGAPMLNDVAGLEYLTVGNKTGAVSWTRTFSPTLINELLVSARRNTWAGGENPEVNTVWADELGLPNPFGVPYWPRFENTGLGTGTDQYALNTNDTKKNFFTFFILDNNVTKIHGKHDLRFGFHFRRDYLNTLPQQRFPQPQLNWGTGATALMDPDSTSQNPLAVPFTGHNIANMFLGHSAMTASMVKGWYYLTGSEYALYFQDNYKITPAFTLNLGLRWEYWPAYHEKNYALVSFDLPSKSIVLNNDLNTLYAQGVTHPSLINRLTELGVSFRSWDELGQPRDLVNSRNNLGPRLGFAYRMTRGQRPFVVRGGYSLSYFNTAMSRWFDRAWQNTPLRANYRYNPNDASLSPDGLPNWFLRNVPTYIDGLNTRDLITLDEPVGINRGSTFNEFVDPNLPDARVHTWNLTFEKEVASSIVARARYVGTRGENEWQTIDHNANPPDYAWYVTTGEPRPTGEFANVARRPIDQNVYGSIREFRHTGYTNTHAIQLEMERRYSEGYAYQIFYVHSNSLTVPSSVPAVNQFLPGMVPTDYDDRNRLINYRRNTSIPKHRVRWNFLAELPFGRGKWLGTNAEGIWDKLIGGWQIAGIGSLRSNYFSLPTDHWNVTGEGIKLYGYQYPIQDCRSGTCFPGYLWWNGYIPPNRINSTDADGNPNGIMGVPPDYKPAVTPLIPWGSTELPSNAPPSTDVEAFWDSNTVWVPLNDGTVQRVGFDSGWHPLQNQYFPSVRQWTFDVSLVKEIPITEDVAARFQIDFFNVFNTPGNRESVGGDGILSTRNSENAPRTTQLTLRVRW